MMVRVRFANKTRKRNKERDRKGGGEEDRELEREGDGWNEARTNVVLSSAIRLVECYFRRTERILSVLLGEWLINTAEVIERGEGGGERGGIMFPGNRKDDDGRVLNKPPVDLSAHLKSPRGVHLASSRCTFARLMSLNWLTWIINLNSFFFLLFKLFEIVYHLIVILLQPKKFCIERKIRRSKYNFQFRLSIYISF